MMHCSKPSSCVVPSAASTSSDVRRQRSAPCRARPRPCAASRARSSPPVSWRTTLFFQSRSLSQVDLRRAERDAVRAPSTCASSMTLAACSSAFDGMQPTFRQTPPSVSQRSTSVTSGRDRRHGTPRCNRRDRRRARRAGLADRRLGAQRARGAARRQRRRRGGAAAGAAAGCCGRLRGSARVQRLSRSARRRPPSRRVSTTSPALQPCRPSCTALRSRCRRAVDGTSIVALSVSSVTSGVSTSSVSPALTSTSMTATSSKLPEIGDAQLRRSLKGSPRAAPPDRPAASTEARAKRAPIAPSITR